MHMYMVVTLINTTEYYECMQWFSGIFKWLYPIQIADQVMYYTYACMIVYNMYDINFVCIDLQILQHCV